MHEGHHVRIDCLDRVSLRSNSAQLRCVQRYIMLCASFEVTAGTMAAVSKCGDMSKIAMLVVLAAPTRIPACILRQNFTFSMQKLIFSGRDRAVQQQCSPCVRPVPLRYHARQTWRCSAGWQNDAMSPCGKQEECQRFTPFAQLEPQARKVKLVRFCSALTARRQAKRPAGHINFKAACRCIGLASKGFDYSGALMCTVLAEGCSDRLRSLLR
jgi:hypothetical protein